MPRIYRDAAIYQSYDLHRQEVLRLLEKMGTKTGNAKRLTLAPAKPIRNDFMYVFKTKGICPKEIHLSLNGTAIEQIRLVGGGCPGNSANSRAAVARSLH